MINLKKACLLATIGALLAPATVMASEQPHDVVHDARGNVVKNTFNNCVITQWVSANDECNGVKFSLTREQRTVYFDFNKSTLNAKEKVKLDEVSKIIKASQAVESVDIVGFADKIGTSSYNKTLSMKRAETVKSYLSAKGLKTRNTRLEAMGDSMPVTKCDAKMDRKDLIACLAADRRVEIQLNVKK